MRTGGGPAGVVVVESRSRVPRPAVAVAAAMLALVLWFYIRTADAMILLFGAWFVVAVALAWWVARDATAQGLPAGLWAVAVLLVPGVGLVAYLVVREMRRR